MIYKWISINFTQSEVIEEPGTFTIATPEPGKWLSVVKLFLCIEGSHSFSQEFQLFFGEREMTGILDVHELKLDLDQFHEVLSGKVDEPFKIVTGSRSVQGFALISENEG